MPKKKKKSNVVPFKKQQKKQLNVPKIEDLQNIAFAVTDGTNESPVFLNKYKVQNMDVECYIVPDATITMILGMHQLTQEQQLQAMNDLVDRELEWLDYDEDVQMDKIKKALIDETVFDYLNKVLFESGYTQVTVALDAEGSIIIELFYIEETL